MNASRIAGSGCSQSRRRGRPRGHEPHILGDSTLSMGTLDRTSYDVSHLVHLARAFGHLHLRPPAVHHTTERGSGHRDAAAHRSQKSPYMCIMNCLIPELQLPASTRQHLHHQTWLLHTYRLHHQPAAATTQARLRRQFVFELRRKGLGVAGAREAVAGSTRSPDSISLRERVFHR